MNDKHIILRPREGFIRTLDLCKHSDCSKEEFFGHRGLKTLRFYGLILELDEVVKVLFEDDESDNEEVTGIVIPKSCVIEICYFTPVDLNDEYDHTN